MINTPTDARQDFSYTLRAKIQTITSDFATKSGWRSFNPKDFKIEQLIVTIPHLARVFHNYRIAHISDIHYGQWISAERLEGIVQLINKHHPDAVAITGDFVSYILDEKTANMITYLKKLRPKDGIFAVLGNHDHWAGAEKVKELLQKSNIKNLTNDIYILRKREATLIFAGVDSAMIRKAHLDRVLEKMPSTGPAIMLAHEPDFAIKTAQTKRFSLQLSGHSHGGQFFIPGIGTPFRGHLSKKYPHGVYKVADMTLFTSIGLGTNTCWLRVNCPPEIAIIDLQRGTQE